MLRAVTTRDPEWDEQQRGWVLALLEDEADRCAGCGHPLSESADPAAENTYTAPLPTRCHACTAVSMRAADYAKAQHPRALLIHAERKT